MKKRSLALLAAAALVAVAIAQQSDIVIPITGQERVAIALPDFRGSGEAQPLMATFNQTVLDDISGSGLFRVVAKEMYPLDAPQRPDDFREPLQPVAPARQGAPPPQPVRRGPWLTDWSDPPVSATYLALGYSAAVDGRLAVFAWLYNVTQPNLTNAQVLGKKYFGSLDQAGARQTAHEFAADILSQFGFKGLWGTKIYYESEQGGAREIWSMDPDGSNQKQLTFHKSMTMGKSVSPDGTILAYAVATKGGWEIRLLSLVTNYSLPFFNPPGSLNQTPDFTPDGKRIVFSSNTAKGGESELYVADINGKDLQRITFSRTIDCDPRVNPKTGRDIVFTSGLSGPRQVYKMNITGTDIQMLSDGTGEAFQPAWSPNGQLIAFAWTRGYAPGHYNIFVMDVAKPQQYVQLTHGAGQNENPNWAPDGVHLVFASTREGGEQIWTMLGDGTQLKKLTTRGRNYRPVWK